LKYIPKSNFKHKKTK